MINGLVCLLFLSVWDANEVRCLSLILHDTECVSRLPAAASPRAGHTQWGTAR